MPILRRSEQANFDLIWKKGFFALFNFLAPIPAKVNYSCLANFSVEMLTKGCKNEKVKALLLDSPAIVRDSTRSVDVLTEGCNRSFRISNSGNYLIKTFEEGMK